MAEVRRQEQEQYEPLEGEAIIEGPSLLRRSDNRRLVHPGLHDVSAAPRPTTWAQAEAESARFQERREAAQREAAQLAMGAEDVRPGLSL